MKGLGLRRFSGVNFWDEALAKYYENTILPIYEKAIDYTDKFEQIMQITMVTFLQTKIDFTQNQIRTSEVQQAVCNAFSRLERVVGKRIDLMDHNFQITTHIAL
ncbi:MAG TPA: hypothetical protein VLB80_00880 [Candidatus Babeliales bacterium]|nr:hypothetical protein [Candidatus Babeliales bacterium]